MYNPNEEITYDLEALKNTEDYELMDMLHWKGFELVSNRYGKVFDLSKPNDVTFLEFYSMWTLSPEVYNGGFDQFFYNNGIDIGKHAYNGYLRINAHEYADLCLKAITIYQHQSDDYITERNPAFDELDNKLFSLDEELGTKLSELQINYIRNNLEAFLR